MIKKFISTFLIFSVVLSLSIVPVFADPEEGEYTGESQEYSEEYSEEYSTETTEEYYESEENEYTGEYSEGYSEEEAIQEEEAWQEQQEYYPEEETVYQEETPVESETSTEEEKTPEEPVLPIVAEDGTIRKPVITSGSAAVYCRNTGELIFAKNQDKRFSPYSITKLLTALLAVQKLPLEQQVTISAAAASQGGSTMALSEGEVVTVEQLLYGTMILSGNDAAYALAETVAGSIEGFVATMNETVGNLGCKNTRFVNPNGLIDDVNQQYTTAKDFLEICKLAFSNDTLKKIAGANEYEMPATNISEAYTMKGHNELLQDGKPGYVAGKTGYWEDDKATIAMDYVNGSLELIVVALGGDIDKRSIDCDQLIDFAMANIEGLKVVEKGTVVSNVRVRHGAVTRIDAVTAGESFVYLPKQASKELIQLVPVIDPDVTAPVKAGDPVGVYQVFLADEKIDEVPLVASVDVEEGWILSYVGISNRSTLIMGFLVLMLVALLILRSVNRARIKKKQRIARRNRIRDMAEEELKKEKEEFESHRGRYYR